MEIRNWVPFLFRLRVDSQGAIMHPSDIDVPFGLRGIILDWTYLNLLAGHFVFDLHQHRWCLCWHFVHRQHRQQASDSSQIAHKSIDRFMGPTHPARAQRTLIEIHHIELLSNRVFRATFATFAFWPRRLFKNARFGGDCCFRFLFLLFRFFFFYFKSKIKNNSVLYTFSNCLVFDSVYCKFEFIYSVRL